MPSRVEELKAIAGQGTPDERVHNLAVYFETLYFDGPPPTPTPPRPRPKRRVGAPLKRIGNEYDRRNRARSRAAQRAFRRLRERHAAEYADLYQEERAREAASTKETA